MKSLVELLESKSNDYSKIENKFYDLTNEKLVGRNLTGNSEIEDRINDTPYSVIVPSYGFTKYLNGLLLSLDNQLGKKGFEVIVVSNYDERDENTEPYKPKNYNLKFIDLDIRGRAFARNVGLAYSKGRIVSFVDSDMILPNNFIREHLYRSSFSEDLVFTSFYSDLYPEGYHSTMSKLIKNRFNFDGDYHDDFRYKKSFAVNEIRNGYNLTKTDTAKEYHILRDTNNFKDFGFYRRYGVWELPMMLLTIGVTLSRKYAVLAGGLNTRFRGWGYEDSYFGATLIGAGAYILPLYNRVPYRIRHKPREGAMGIRNKQARENRDLYYKLLDSGYDINKLARSFSDEYSVRNLERKGISHIRPT